MPVHRQDHEVVGLLIPPLAMPPKVFDLELARYVISLEETSIPVDACGFK
jgi:hypothetical protein